MSQPTSQPSIPSVALDAFPCSSCGTNRTECAADPGWACCPACDKQPRQLLHVSVSDPSLSASTAPETPVSS